MAVRAEISKIVVAGDHVEAQVKVGLCRRWSSGKDAALVAKLGW